MYLNTQNIECKCYCTYFKYQGIYFDEYLQREPEIQHVNKKLANNIGIINRLRHDLDLHVLKQFY